MRPDATITKTCPFRLFLAATRSSTRSPRTVLYSTITLQDMCYGLPARAFRRYDLGVPDREIQ